MRIRAILLALLMAVGMSGQDLAFRHYSDYDGLWRNAIRALAQDKYGFIWIGADAGLYRFDGISMRSFQTSDDKSVQSVYALLDMGDSLMVGTDDGAFVLNYKTEAIYRLALKPVWGGGRKTSMLPRLPLTKTIMCGSPQWDMSCFTILPTMV